MHEFELGVWKTVFIHLIRMLVSFGGLAVQELNLRYVGISYDHILLHKLVLSYRFRYIETFGRGTIRRFDRNTSALKKLAARNYEDCLQVRLSTKDLVFPQVPTLIWTFSVLCPSSKVSFLIRNMTSIFKTSSLSWLSGTLMRNSVCTRNQQFRCCET